MDDYRSRLMAQKLGAEGMKTLVAAVEDLKKAIDNHDEKRLDQLSKNKAMFLKIFEYLVLNQDNPNIDPRLLIIVMKFLGIEPKSKKKERSEEEDDLHPEGHFYEMTEEERKQYLRMVFYEAYKMLNPHAIAGETYLQNFIKNVQIRGVEEALKYEGSEFAKTIDVKDLKELDHSGKSFVEELDKQGFKGFGRGL